MRTETLAEYSKRRAENVQYLYDELPRHLRDVEKKQGHRYAGYPAFGDELDPPKPTRARNRYRTPIRSMT